MLRVFSWSNLCRFGLILTNLRPTVNPLLVGRGTSMRSAQVIEERIVAYLREDGACALWTGPLGNCGPRISMPGCGPGVKLNVRHFIFEKVHGVKPKMVRTTCGNRLCVRPEHLVEHAPSLSSEDKAQIVERWAMHLIHTTSIRSLAEEYGVSMEEIRKAIKAGI